MYIDGSIQNSSSKWAEAGENHLIIKKAVLFNKPIENIKGKLSTWTYDLPIEYLKQIPNIKI